MNQQERNALRAIRNEIRDTFQASVRRPRVVTEQERLEDISLKLARTLNSIEQEIGRSVARR